MDTKLFLNLKDQKSISEFLNNPTLFIAEIFTAIAQNPSQLAPITGRLIQAALINQQYKQFAIELKNLREQGKIKNNFFETCSEQSSLCELLKFIDEQNPDEERYKAMKALFFTSVSVSREEQDKALAYKLMKILRELESDNLELLKARYDIHKGNYSPKLGENFDTQKIQGYPGWANVLAKQLGHGIQEFVTNSEPKLVEYRLLLPSDPDIEKGHLRSTQFRLSPLGLKLCEFIYDGEFEIR